MKTTLRKSVFCTLVAAHVLMAISSPAFCGAIQDALKSGDLRLVDELIGVAPELVNERDESNATPLHLAVSKNHISMTELLLAHKADINARDINGSTPLHLAAESGHVALATLLLARGADASAQDNQDLTPLMKAANAGKHEIVKLLLMRAARVNGVNSYDNIAKTILERKTNAPAPITSNNKQPIHVSDDVHAIVLEEEAPVRLRVRRELSSKRVKPGDIVELEASEEVIRKGFPLIPLGSIATARVITSKPARMAGRGGSLDLELIAVRDLLGREVALRGISGARGSDESFTDWLNQAAAADPRAVIFAIPLYLLVMGDNAVLRKGDGITAHIKDRSIYDPQVLEDRYKKFVAERNRGWMGKARVHLYRMPDEEARNPLSRNHSIAWKDLSVRKVRVFLNGAELTRLPASRNLTLVIDPGLYIFQTRASRMDFDLESGKEYYLRADKKQMLTQVEEDEGRFEIYALKPLTLGDSSNAIVPISNSSLERGGLFRREGVK